VCVGVGETEKGKAACCVEMSSSSGTFTGPAWVGSGAFGGAALGLTVGGPLGAWIGGGVGLAAGAVRAISGKSVAEHWTSMPRPVANSSSCCKSPTVTPNLAALPPRKD
jgi:hypothetical protein